MTRHYRALLKKFKQLDYPANEGGMCNGITLKWIEACLLREETAFDDRILLILRADLNIREQMDRIKDVIRRDGTTSPENAEYLRILGFMEGVQLYQAPELYFELFQKNLTQDNFEDVSQIAGSDRIRALGGLERIYSEIN